MATSLSQYPAVSFQLPSNAYLFVATAMQQSSYYQPYQMYARGGASGQAGPSTSSSPASYPVQYRQPIVEYGYAIQQISGSAVLTITTKAMNETATSTLSIRASYANGTPASNVYISASIVGNWYWWGDASGTRPLTMWSTTDSQGVATLVTPSVPVLVSAWASIPVNLPTNQTTVQTTIVGEKVNVTVYWQPTYVSFAGWVLVTPPKSGAEITLRYQQPTMYWVTPYGVKMGMGGISGAPADQSGLSYPAVGPGGIPPPVLVQQQEGGSTTTVRTTTLTSTVQASSSATNDILSPANILFLVGVSAAIAAVTASVLVAVVVVKNRGHREQTP